ncbi:hypothetical protein HBB16_13760 [Pseudonocardia sp. MCCB 268]|nr:hypothetical protein [Pseudonocardia cytotoxica]
MIDGRHALARSSLLAEASAPGSCCSRRKRGRLRHPRHQPVGPSTVGPVRGWSVGACRRCQALGERVHCRRARWRQCRSGWTTA